MNLFEEANKINEKIMERIQQAGWISSYNITEFSGDPVQEFEDAYHCVDAWVVIGEPWNDFEAGEEVRVSLRNDCVRSSDSNRFRPEMRHTFTCRVEPVHESSKSEFDKVVYGGNKAELSIVGYTNGDEIQSIFMARFMDLRTFWRTNWERKIPPNTGWHAWEEMKCPNFVYAHPYELDGTVGDWKGIPWPYKIRNIVSSEAENEMNKWLAKRRKRLRKQQLLTV